jgi:hypothetical protein
MIFAPCGDQQEHLLSSYDFVGITERFDESVVAMQLLLGLRTSDVLYLKAKGGAEEGLDGAGGYKTSVSSSSQASTCHRVCKSIFNLPNVRNDFDTI